ncbi:hypothetical protein HYU14_06420 [Candidatus Woesearchaeota archaeon]|nr:hypothetical protein [Candidatus Woesearchaeota archaeon]
MSQVTLEQINRNILDMRVELHELKAILREDFPLASDLKDQIKESLGRPDSDFIPHLEVKKRFS